MDSAQRGGKHGEYTPWDCRRGRLRFHRLVPLGIEPEASRTPRETPTPVERHTERKTAE